MATSLFSANIATIPLSPSSLHPTLLPPLSHPHDFIRFRHHRRRQIPSFAASFPPHQVSPIVNAIENDQSPQRTSTDSEDEIDNLGVRAALSMLRFYKREISPLLPSSCRYVPTCSEYSMISYKKYGVVKGTILTAWRICRCNPLGGSGFDPPRWFGEGDPLDD